MISRDKIINVTKAVAKGAWDSLPSILSVIPQTMIAGKILVEVKKIADNAINTGTSDDKVKEAVEAFVKEYGSVEAFKEAMLKELRENRDSKNPKYINCALFTVKPGDALSEEEQAFVAGVLSGEVKTELEQLNNFVRLFMDEYFGGDINACDCGYEVAAEYIAFNFDDSVDHEYDEEDLKLIMNKLNEIVGRPVFHDYEGYGTEDSISN